MKMARKVRPLSIGEFGCFRQPEEHRTVSINTRSGVCTYIAVKLYHPYFEEYAIIMNRVMRVRLSALGPSLSRPLELCSVIAKHRLAVVSAVVAESRHESASAPAAYRKGA